MNGQCPLCLRHIPLDEDGRIDSHLRPVGHPGGGTCSGRGLPPRDATGATAQLAAALLAGPATPAEAPRVVEALRAWRVQFAHRQSSPYAPSPFVVRALDPADLPGRILATPEASTMAAAAAQLAGGRRLTRQVKVSADASCGQLIVGEEEQPARRGNAVLVREFTLAELVDDIARCAACGDPIEDPPPWLRAQGIATGSCWRCTS